MLADSSELARLEGVVAKRADRRPAQALHVMAAAYAEAGRMDEAVNIAKLAAETARARGDLDLTESIGRSLLLFQQGKPLRSS